MRCSKAQIQPNIRSNRSTTSGRRKNHPVRRFAIGSALIAALATLSACGTTGDKGDDGGVKVSDGGTTAPSAIVKSMGGGLIGGSIGAGLSDAEKTSALGAEYRALEYSQAGQPVT